MTPIEVSRELRLVQRKHENDFVPTFGVNISDMARDAANAIDELIAMLINGSPYCWVPVTERLPEKPQYDWVLVRTKCNEDKRGYGMPHIAELRHGVWYCTEHDQPMEDLLALKVTDWFDMQLIKEPQAIPEFMKKEFHIGRNSDC